MSDNTQIEWADATVNAVNGCSVHSPGCANCYAMRLAGTRLKHHPSRAGLTRDSKAGPVWTGEVRLSETALLQPLRWKRPRRIFWNAHGDLFHENVPDAWIDRVFAVCALTSQHTHMILTKRSARMRDYFSADRRADLVSYEGRAGWPLPNVWLGVSVEDQTRADERIPDLLATPAAIRFISAEPLLGPVDLSAVPWHVAGYRMVGALPDKAEADDFRYWHHEMQGIRWVIAGGESGSGARPMHPDWARSLRDQCAAAGVPFHFKQWGEWAPICEMDEELINSCYHPAPEQHPEARRRCKTGQCVLHAGAQRFDGNAMFERAAFEQGSRAMTMFAVGKKRAGRALDGVTHDGLPA